VKQPIIFVLAIILAFRIFAQDQPKSMAFDLASIHESKPEAGNEKQESNVPLGPGNVYSPTDGQLNTHNMPLLQLIAFAYRMTSSEEQALREAAPGWAREGRYDVQARTDKHDVTKDELRLMMRSLLADRFSLVVHYATKTASVYAMQFVKRDTPGPQLRPHTSGACSTDFQGKTSSPAADGYPSVCGGLLLLPGSTDSHYRIGARDIPIATIATSLSSWGDLGRPVVNDTGSTGNYDFVLDFVPPRVEAASKFDVEGPSFLEALRKQLGIKLEGQKLPMKGLVLDHIDHLSEN
jgi:uncharacterized protein (TIGR03435 family)